MEKGPHLDARVKPFAWRLYALVLVGLGPGGCSAGSAASLVRPSDPRADAALGEAACRGVAREAQPLIVDMAAHQRADIEEAVKGGIALVAYDCKALRLVKDCRAEGAYRFQGLALREQTVRLEDADEIRANLPSFGPQIVAKMSGEVARGATLDLAMMMVGKRRTTVSELARAGLDGRCDDATHFVRGVYVGAFAMTTGTRGQVRGAAEIFGVGTSASSESQKLGTNRDGDIAACKGAAASDGEPPQACSSLLRLELTAIASGVEADGASNGAEIASSPEWRACPEGMVLTDAKCAKPTDDRPFQCRSEQPVECDEQCQKGHGGSCATLGFLYERGIGVGADAARAASLFDKSCAAGDAYGCTNLGVMLERGEGLPKDLPRAAGLYRQSCERGDENGCYNLGLVYEAGRGVAKDEARAATLYQKGCDGGEASACNNLGFLLERGRGRPADATKARELYQRACEGGSEDGCFNLGVLHEEGRGGARKDALRALSLYTEACEKKAGRACSAVATFHEEGTVVTKDLPKAAALYRRGCDLGDLDGCVNFAFLLETGAGVPRDDVEAAKIYLHACDSGNGVGCTNLGGMLELGRGIPKDEPRAAKLYRAACDKDHPPACGNLAEMTEIGAGGLKRDKAAAIALFDKACKGGHASSCAALKKLAP